MYDLSTDGSLVVNPNNKIMNKNDRLTFDEKETVWNKAIAIISDLLQ